ncbi:MAG: hypothetical protein ACAI34_12385 [Verrucomicrobium sp.]|nr:hypothetical protein [Verrucomicrobium sp.]
MNLLKRFELWVLLAIIVAGLTYVFTSGPADEGEEDSTSKSGTAESNDKGGPLKLHRVALERDYGNVRLDVDLRIRNDKTEKLLLHAPTARLLTTQGREVPSFFLPFAPPPEVAAGSTQDVQLRYWLEAADLQQGLTLDIGGNTLEIKAPTPLDIETLKSGEKKEFTGPIGK